MKTLRSLIALSLSLASPLAAASAPEGGVPLDQALDSLNLPDNRAPAPVSREKLYAVQTRFSPLRATHELAIGGGRMMVGESFLASHQLEAGYRFHLNDRWSLGVSGAWVFNRLTGAADRLLEQENRLPDISYARRRVDLTLMRNNFYGKFRASLDRVFYFDQYVALGAGVVDQARGMTPAAVADIGFAFWLGHRGSIRFGFKDYWFQERRELSQGMTHNVQGYLNVGLLLGGDRS